jgi:hypothetical protein
VVSCNSDDIVYVTRHPVPLLRVLEFCCRYSNLFTGVHGNYLAPSIKAAGLDPNNLPESDPSKMNFGGDAKAWKDIW